MEVLKAKVSEVGFGDVADAIAEKLWDRRSENCLVGWDFRGERLWNEFTRGLADESKTEFKMKKSGCPIVL